MTDHTQNSFFFLFRLTCSYQSLVSFTPLTNPCARPLPSLCESGTSEADLHSAASPVRVGVAAHLDTLHSKSRPSCRESTKQLAEPSEDRECLAMSAPFISFIIARALALTSCLKELQGKQTHSDSDVNKINEMSKQTSNQGTTS